MNKPSSSTTIPIAEKLSDHCSFDLAQASKSYIFSSSSVKDKDTPLTSKLTEKDDSLSSVVETKQATTAIESKPETIAHYSSELNTEAIKICNENFIAEKSKLAVIDVSKEVNYEERLQVCDQSMKKVENSSETFIEKMVVAQTISEQPTSQQLMSEISSKDEPRRSGRKRSTKSFGNDTITFPLKKEKTQTSLKNESTETAVVDKNENLKSDVAPTRSSERKRLVNSKYRGEDIYTPTTKKMIQHEKTVIDHQGDSKHEKKTIKNNHVNTTSSTTKPVDTSIKVETRRRSFLKSNEPQTKRNEKQEKQSNIKSNEVHKKSFVQDEQAETKLEQIVSKPVKSTIEDDKLLQNKNRLNESFEQSQKATLLPLDEKQLTLPEIVKSIDTNIRSKASIKFDTQPELASNIKLKDTNVNISKSPMSSQDEKPIEVFSNFNQTGTTEKSTISIQDEKQLDEGINMSETLINSSESIHSQNKQLKEVSSSYGITDTIPDFVTKDQMKENFQTTTENIPNKPIDSAQQHKQSDLLTSHPSLSKDIEKPTNTCNEILHDNDLQKTLKTENEKTVIKKTKVEKPTPGKAASKNFEEKYELFKQKWKAEKEKRRLMKETLSKQSVSTVSPKPSVYAQSQVSSPLHHETTTFLPQPNSPPISLAQISTIKNTTYKNLTEKDSLVRSTKEKPSYSSQQGTKTLTQRVASKLHKKAQAHQKQKQEAETERKTSTEKEEIDLTAITLRSMKSPPRFDEKSSGSKKKSLDFITGRLNYKKKMELLKSEVKQQKSSTDYFNLLQSPPLSAQTSQDNHCGNHKTNPVIYDNESSVNSALKITLPSSSNCSLPSQATPIADYKHREMKTPDKTTNKSKGTFQLEI